MSTAVAQPRLQVAFAGAFAIRLEQPVRAHLSMPCDIILAKEVGIVSRPSGIVDKVLRRSDAVLVNVSRTEIIAE
jgi:hypothetical protein